MRRLTSVFVSALVSSSFVAACARSDDGASSITEVAPATEPTGQSDGRVAPPSGSQNVSVTVNGLEYLAGRELAGVVSRDRDGLVVGGFAVDVGHGDATTTQIVMQPADLEGSTDQVGAAWPHLTDTPATVEPGAYLLTLWTDDYLSAYGRWVPANADGAGLDGCVHRFEVGEQEITEVVLDGNLAGLGYAGICRAERT